MTQEQTDNMFMQMCDVIAQQSYARRAKVGALIAKDGNVLSIGMNGMPSGMPNVCETAHPTATCYQELERATFGAYLPNCNLHSELVNGVMVLACDHADTCKFAELRTNPEVLHAEANALMKLVRSGSGRSSDGATLYCTYSPCIHCAKMILQAGIVRVVYKEDYHDESGANLLRSNNISVIKWQKNNDL